jgi:hypothetical protein
MVTGLALNETVRVAEEFGLLPEMARRSGLTIVRRPPRIAGRGSEELEVARLQRGGDCAVLVSPEVVID